MGIDIRGIGVMGVDILGVDIMALIQNKHAFVNYTFPQNTLFQTE